MLSLNRFEGVCPIVAIVLPALGIIISDILKLFKTIGKKSKNKELESDRAIEAKEKLKEVVKDEAEEE